MGDTDEVASDDALAGKVVAVGQPGPRPCGAGRQKGKLNRLTTLKNDFFECFYAQEMGGLEGLISWASLNNDNRTTFYKMVVQLMPKDLKLSGDGNAPLATKVVIEIKDASLEDDPRRCGDDGVIEGELVTEKDLSNEAVAKLVHENFPEAK